MKDIYFAGCCLRVFRKRLSFPYFFHNWGFYGFGAGPFGFMFWPARSGSELLSDVLLIARQAL